MTSDFIDAGQTVFSFSDSQTRLVYSTSTPLYKFNFQYYFCFLHFFLVFFPLFNVEDVRQLLS